MKIATHDVETTGKTRSFEQILQYAAVLTDGGFYELDRFNLRCRLLPHVVPSPQALLVTGVRVRELEVDAVTGEPLPSYYEMMTEIVERLPKWQPDYLNGYNSIRFDRQKIQAALYENLFEPYLLGAMGIKNEIDTFGIVHATVKHAPEALQIPTKNGKQSFKLDRLAPENGFDHADAHDALADDRATLHIDKIIAENAPDIWLTALELSNRNAVLRFMSDTKAFTYRSSTVAYIGSGARGEAYLFNLDTDPDTLRGLSDDELQKVVNAKSGPIQKLRPNTNPILFAVHDTDVNARAATLLQDKEFCAKLVRLIQPTEYPPSPHVEEQMLDSFYSAKDKRLLQNFHSLPWEQRLGFLDQFTDKRIKQLGRRLVYFERPDLLDPQTKLNMDRWVAERISTTDETVPWLTLPKAIKELQELKADPQHADKMDHMLELEAYYEDRLLGALAVLQGPTTSAKSEPSKLVP